MKVVSTKLKEVKVIEYEKNMILEVFHIPYISEEE